MSPQQSAAQINAGTAELKQSLTKAIQQKDNKNALQYSLQLAEIHTNEKKYEEAIRYFAQSLQFSKPLKEYESQFKAYSGQGQAFTELKNYKSAINAYEASVEASESAHNKTFQAIGLFHVAMANEDAGRDKRTIDPLQRALALSIELKDEMLQLDCYNKLATNYAKLGDVEKATMNKNLYNQMMGSRQSNETSKKKLSQLKQKVTQVEAEKAVTEKMLTLESEKLRRAEDSLQLVEAINHEKEMQISLLNKEKELSDLKLLEKDIQIENEKLWRNSIIGGTLLGTLLIAIVIIDYRKKLAANKKIHQQSENIKSSINYAKRIQEAMLPKHERFESYISDSFVLFKPRNTVSGDFYWFSEIKNGAPEKDFAFAAVDCTGHGVPGAFMSMIGMNSLNAITGRGITKPNQILQLLHTEIRTALHQEETGNNDGMDVALCVFKKNKNTIEFSGAKNPLVYIKNNELTQVKGDLHPIGGSNNKSEIIFKVHEITIDQPTTVYLFSDGYRDQFGGKTNTKFMSKKFTQLLLQMHQLPMPEQKELLDHEFERWRGSNVQTDDILVMGIKFEPSEVVL